MKKSIRSASQAIVALIGLYMIFTFGANGITPPLLSGIAFLLLGLAGLMK